MSSIMKPRIPEIDNLLRKLQNDPYWKDYRLVYNYFDKTTGKFISEILDNIPEKQEDYRLYLFDFLIRTRRIFSSIVLLAIYGKLADMNILYRPLLENIVQTKIFLKGRRAKSVRAINLYRLINNLKEKKNNFGDFLQVDDIDILFDELGCNDINNAEKSKQELLGYYHEEIMKMEKIVKQGIAWHGRSVKGALREINLIDELEDYYDSCKFIHVRDYGLTGLDGYCGNKYAKLKLFMISLNCIYHLNDFKRACPNFFKIKRKNSKQIDCVMLLTKLMGQILLIASPELSDSIQDIIKPSQQDINI